MRNWFVVTLTFAVLSAGVAVAQTQPIPDNPIWAQTTLGINLKTRCPDLRIADEGTIATIVFWLPRSGSPSSISVKSSSGSNALDSAAVGCVSRLRFASATRLGDGEPIDSWQQIGLRWADQGSARDTRSMASQNAAVDVSGGQPNSVTVHVCVDDTGKLKGDPTIVESSGKAALDQAALRIAASGSAYYRPQISSNGPAVSGCAQLAIKFE